MNARVVLAAILVLALTSTGCVTGPSRAQARRLQQEADIQELRNMVDALDERIKAQEIAQQEILRRLEDIRRRTSDTQDETRSELRQLKQALNRAEAARQADKKQLYEKLSIKIADVMNTSSRPPGSSSEYAREHTVKSGDTMSEIARDYGTTVKAIMEENNLKNADSIKIGQTLFIPM